MQYIYIHGLGQSAFSWNAALSAMKMENPALCPNLTELLHGRESTYTSLYSAFSQYCGALPEPLSLCGVSLGGILALHYTIENPNRVGALVLIGAQYKMPRFLLKLQSVIFRFMRKSSFQQTGFAKEDLIRLSNSMKTLDFSGDLKKVVCKALVLCGERDKANQKAARELAAGLNRAELCLVEGAGHEVNLDAPEKLASLLDSYYVTI